MNYTNLLHEAETLSQSGKKTQAVNIYETAIQLFPNEIDPYVTYAFFLYRQGQWNKAEELFAHASSLDPDDASILNNLGVIQYHLNKVTQARENFEKALSSDPSYADAARNLRKSRLDNIQKKIEHAFLHYELGKFHHLAAYVNNLKTQYLLARTITNPIASRLCKLKTLAGRNSNKKEILFLSVFPRVEMAKKAEALVRTGKYAAKLLCMKTSTGIMDDFLHQCFDEIITYTNWYELICFLLSLKPDIILARPRDQIAALAIIFSNEPVLFNVYDIVTIDKPRQYQDPLVVEAEQFCFENSQGIIHKGSKDEIEKYISPIYKIKAPVLHFYPFCWDKYFVRDSITKFSEKNGAPQLVYTGIVAPSGGDKATTGQEQFQPLINEITKQNIYLSMYYNPETGINDSRYAEYFELSKTNKYFQFNTSLPYHMLPNEISKYDYGIMIHDVRGTAYSKANFEVSMANKLFTYLEAGLPLIVGDTYEAVANFVKEYSVGIIVDPTDLSNLSEKLRSVDYQQLKANVIRARNALSIQNNIHKLSDFIENILQ
ncbi:MAG: tetratricopeptide repeat protein [Candidatus Brocadiaceae bacterium]|nr:tetratricopeptide repeat protein [Candidatus Brocadiaceae bacterium]